MGGRLFADKKDNIYMGFKGGLKKFEFVHPWGIRKKK
jgi:hypothetical protein